MSAAMRLHCSQPHGCEQSEDTFGGGFGSEIYKSHVIDAPAFHRARPSADLWGSDPKVSNLSNRISPAVAWLTSRSALGDRHRWLRGPATTCRQTGHSTSASRWRPSQSSPNRAFVAPTGGSRGPRESFARPCGAAPPGPGAVRAAYPDAHTAAGLLAIPSAASYSRPASTAKGARWHGPPRLVVYRVEGEPRRPGIHLDWVTG